MPIIPCTYIIMARAGKCKSSNILRFLYINCLQCTKFLNNKYTCTNNANDKINTDKGI